MENIKINLDNIEEHYMGRSIDYVEKDWLKEYSQWKEYGYDDIHILTTYLKFTEVLKNIYKKQMFKVDKDILLKWVENAFSKNFEFLNLSDVNIFQLKKTFSFDFSNDLIESIFSYALSEKNSKNELLVLQTLILKLSDMEDMDSKIKNNFFNSVFKKYDILTNPEKIVECMGKLTKKKELENTFKLLEDFNININWNGLSHVKKLTNPINNLNKVFLNYLISGSLIKKEGNFITIDDKYFDFYMEKRNSLLSSQSKDEIKDDFKFFLAVVNVPKEEYLISAINKWPKIKLEKTDMSTPFRGNLSLQDVLLEKKNFRTLDKFLSSISLTETQILSSNIRSHEIDKSRTISSIVNLLINSESNNDWTNFIKSFLSTSSKNKNEYIVIDQVRDFQQSHLLSEKIRQKIKTYISSYINNDNNLSHSMWECFTLKSLDNITENDWTKENKNSTLLIDFFNEHVKILGENGFSNKKNIFFKKTNISDIEQTKFKTVLSNLSIENTKKTIKEFSEYWENNEPNFFNFYINDIYNQRLITEKLVDFSTVLQKIESYLIWLNPTFELNHEITQLEHKIQKYKIALINSLEKKDVIFLKKEDVISGIDKTSILWEQMRLQMLIEKTEIPPNKVKKF